MARKNLTQFASIEMNLLKKNIEKFHKVAIKHSEAGAYDTEPLAVFEHEIRKRVERSDYEFQPLTREAWQLYSNKPHKMAVQQLNKALEDVIEAFEIESFVKVKEAIDYYFSWDSPY